jgi:hypothetical protein
MKANGETREKLGQSARISSPVPPGQGGKGSYSGRQTSTGGGRAQQSRDFPACQGLWKSAGRSASHAADCRCSSFMCVC